MRKMRTMFAAVSVLTILVLTGCGSDSSSINPPPSTAMMLEESSAPPSLQPTAEPKLAPIEVFPATVHYRGVKQHTNPDLYADYETYISYTCAAGLESVALSVLDRVDYKSTTVTFVQEWLSGLADWQNKATLSFDGPGVKALSMKLQSVVVELRPRSGEVESQELIGEDDQQVVNATPQMVSRGMVMNTMDFGVLGNIKGLTLCVKP